MKRTIVLSSILLALFVSRPVEARDVELGVIIGRPEALISLKGWQSRTRAFDAAAGWSFDHDFIHIHASYLWHNSRLFPVSQGEMPVFWGVGGTVEAWDHGSWGGVRIPVGISYLLPSVPLDIFLELAPTVVLTDVDLELYGGIGIRYMFGR
jgi:hypothetical protein